MCQVQEATGSLLWEDWQHLPWDSQQETLYPPERLLQSDGERSLPTDYHGKLDWANGLPSADRLWEQPEGMKNNCTASCGGLWRLCFLLWGAFGFHAF